MRAALTITTLAAVLAASSYARPARADGEDPALAESLFQEARKLSDAGNFKEACPKFLASQKASPAAGTLLNLGACYEKLGLFASAWARYREAVAAAQRSGRADREKTARERAQKVEPRLSHLTITAKESGIEIRRDDVVIDDAALGTQIPIDAGSHTITARAAGKKTWTKTLSVLEAQSESITIPALDEDPNHESQETGTTPPKPADPDNPAPAKSGGSGLRTGSYVALGLGVVGVGVGTYFGIQTFSNWSSAQPLCPRNVCDSGGVTLADKAKNDGNISTVAFVIGGVFVATGAVLFIVSPSSNAKSSLFVAPNVSPSFAGLSFGGGL